MSKPRKKYRPKPVKTCTLQLAMQGWAFLSKEDQEAKAAPVREAVAFIAQGKGTKEHWSAIFDALNMLEQFNQMPQVMTGARDYIESMHASNLELAAEYLVMAAMLIEIKSRMLLPRPKVAEGEDAEDPRAELVRRLMEYEQMKIAGQNLNQLPQAERDFFWVETLVEKSLYVRLPEVSVGDLKDAWMSVVRQARLNRNHKIGREELSVREHMAIILRVLQEKGGFVQFENLFDAAMGVPGLVVHFLAMLELGREKLIEITQTEPFQPIYVRVHQDGAEPDQESA